MPFYEYRCEDCGENFEYFARTMSDQPENCSKCGRERIKKMYSTFGVKGGSDSGGEHSSASFLSACSSCSAGSCTGCTG